MNAHYETQLDTYLDRIVRHIQQLRNLDVSDEAGLDLAMAQSRQVMGTLAMYRRQLQTVEARTLHPLRQAA